MSRCLSGIAPFLGMAWIAQRKQHLSTAYNNYLINAWMGVTKPEQPQTLEEVIAHYKGDSRVVDANHDVFDYVMLRKEFTEDKQGNPTPEGQG